MIFLKDDKQTTICTIHVSFTYEFKKEHEVFKQELRNNVNYK